MLKLKSLCGFYIGYERQCEEPMTFSRAFFRELAEPWRVGKGFRVRFGTKAIQVGRCRRNTEGDMSALKQLGGRELPMFDPSEIGRWNGQGVESTGVRPGPTDPAA